MLENLGLRKMFSGEKHKWSGSLKAPNNMHLYHNLWTVLEILVIEYRNSKGRGRSMERSFLIGVISHKENIFLDMHTLNPVDDYD